MTTPERFRRRQRLEGAFLVVLAVITLTYGIWDNQQAHHRDACMSDNFRRSGDVQETRAHLAEKATALSLEVDNNQEQVIKSISQARTQADVRAAFDAYNERDAELDTLQAKILADRKATKIPPFPDGTCE